MHELARTFDEIWEFQGGILESFVYLLGISAHLSASFGNSIPKLERNGGKEGKRFFPYQKNKIFSLPTDHWHFQLSLYMVGGSDMASIDRPGKDLHAVGVYSTD